MVSTRRSITFTDIAALAAVGVFLYLLFFKLPFTPFYLEDDHLIFLDNAARMLGGERLYIDFFQFSFPGGQVFYLLLFAIFGVKYWLLNFAIVATWTLTFWLALRISKRVIDGPLAYMPPMLFAFFGLRWFGLDGSHRSLSPVFIWIALLLLLWARTPILLALAGALCAASAFFTQQRGLVAAVAIAVFVAVDNYARSESLKKTVKDVAIVGISFGVTLAALCSYFIATAGLGNFLASTLEYPSKYYHYDPSNNPGVFLRHLRYTFSSEALTLEFVPALFYAFGVPIALIVFFAVYLRYRKQHDWEFWRTPMLVAILAVFLVLSTTAPSQVRYFPIAIPSLVLTFWLVNFFGVLKRYQLLLVRIACLCLIAVSAFLLIKIQRRADYKSLTTTRGTMLYVQSDAMERYAFLNEHTKPGDFVFETPFPCVYFMLDLRNASRYSQFVPSEYTRPEQVFAAVNDLEITRPRYILWSGKNNVLDAERQKGDNLGPLSKYILDKYEPVDLTARPQNPSIEIWQRKDDIRQFQ